MLRQTTKSQIWLSTVLLCSAVGAHAIEVENATYTSKTYATKFAKGLVRTPATEQFLRTAPRESFLDASTPVPKKYSLRGKAGPVEDQGQCGSCWDFSLTSVLRGSWITAGKDPGRLSFNYLLNCAKTSQGCDGGDFTAAEYFVHPKGAPAYGSDGEYQGTAGNCQMEKTVASTVSYKILGTDLGANPKAPLPSFKDLAYVVGVLHQPVSIDVAVDDAWQNYSGGVYNGCSDEVATDINHMVSLEGYDCETAVDQSGNCVFDAKGNLPPGVGRWIIRNSWSDSWGDNGYITTKATDKKGARCNAVATDALYYNLQGH